MFFDKEELGDSEKLEAVHRMLIAERRSRRYWIFLRLLIIGGLVYGYHYVNLPENADLKKRMLETTEQKLAEFVAPIAQSVMERTIANMQIPGNAEKTEQVGTVVTPVTVTPEMIKAVQESMGK